MRRGGRDAAPKILPYPMNDYGTGLMGAYAVALAVHERNRTGEGQTVNSGLALTAGLLQSPFFLDYEGYQRDEPEGLDVRGFSAKSHLYEAADGWMYLHCPSDEAWANLVKLSGFTGLDEGSDDALTQSLVKILAGKPRAEWEKLINPTGVSVMANRMVADFRDDADIRKAGLIVGRNRPGVGQAAHHAGHRTAQRDGLQLPGKRVDAGGLGRFRVNVFTQRSTTAMVLRYVKAEIPTCDKLGVPEILKGLILLKRGMILILAGAVTLAIASASSSPSFATIILPAWILAVGIVFTVSVTPNGAMAEFGDRAGLAVALYFAGHSVIVAILGTGAVIAFNGDTAGPLIAFAGAMSTTILILQRVKKAL